MRNFRGQLPQADFAAKIGKQKTVVGRLEKPAYGGWSLRTMLLFDQGIHDPGATLAAVV